MSVVTDMAPPPPDSGRPRGARGTLGPLRVPKASDILAEELAGRIIRGEISQGSNLPAERSLVAQTGLSRGSVREALKVLEVRGFVEIRAGRGGAVVRRPGGHQLATSVRTVVRGTQVALASLLETRATIEPVCAGLAAVHRTEGDVREMEVTCREMADAPDVSRFLRANVDWHVTVAQASGNELLAGLMVALTELIYDSAGHVGTVDDAVRVETCRAHRAITAAVRAGDRELARRRMGRHLEAYVDAVDEEISASLNWTGLEGG